jgi:hypothetical protein
LVYFSIAWLLGLKECWMLFRSSARPADDNQTPADSV